MRFTSPDFHQPDGDIAQSPGVPPPSISNSPLTVPGDTFPVFLLKLLFR